MVKTQTHTKKTYRLTVLIWRILIQNKFFILPYHLKEFELQTEVIFRLEYLRVSFLLHDIFFLHNQCNKKHKGNGNMQSYQLKGVVSWLKT